MVCRVVRSLSMVTLAAVTVGFSALAPVGTRDTIALAECSQTTSEDSEVSAAPAAPIDVALDVEPTTVSQATLDELTVRGVITNHGDAAIDTQLIASELLINGQPSFAWGLAIGNGYRDMRETALPPGEQVDFSRVLGKSLVHAPGDYEIVLRVLGVDSGPVQIHVQ
jgi:hypothetical protein